MPGVKTKVVPSGFELTILDTLSLGCKVTCAQLSRLRTKNASGWRIMIAYMVDCPPSLLAVRPRAIITIIVASGNEIKTAGTAYSCMIAELAAQRGALNKTPADKKAARKVGFVCF